MSRACCRTGKRKSRGATLRHNTIDNQDRTLADSNLLLSNLITMSGGRSNMSNQMTIQRPLLPKTTESKSVYDKVKYETYDSIKEGEYCDTYDNYESASFDGETSDVYSNIDYSGFQHSVNTPPFNQTQFPMSTSRISDRRHLPVNPSQFKAKR